MLFIFVIDMLGMQLFKGLH